MHVITDIVAGAGKTGIGKTRRRGVRNPIKGLFDLFDLRYGAERLFAAERVSFVLFEMWPAVMAKLEAPFHAENTLAFLGSHGFACFDMNSDTQRGEPLNFMNTAPYSGAVCREFSIFAENGMGGRTLHRAYVRAPAISTAEV